MASFEFLAVVLIWAIVPRGVLKISEISMWRRLKIVSGSWVAKPARTRGGRKRLVISLSGVISVISFILI